MSELDNNNKNIIKSIYYNNSNKKITEGRVCNSLSASNMKHINLESEYTNSFYFKEAFKEKKLGQFIFEKKIGEGTFGKVILAKDEITEERVAIKILDKQKILKETNKSKLEREIKILKLLRHNNIVHLYNVIETSTNLYLIMEYIKGIELFEYINEKHYLTEVEACKFYQQIISGIEYLGKIKVVHRDIKPENLLISNKDTIKIVDFGLSNTYFNDNLLSTACGSPCYAAPEMIKGKKYSGLCVDIWSSGVVLYAMLCGSLPFEDDNNDKLYKKILKGKLEIPKFLSELASDFLHCILNVNPDERYTIEEIKMHPWFNQVNPKFYMSEGLLIKNVVVPIDENIISIMVNKYMFNEEDIKINLILNKHNQITTIYYLILKKIIKKGQKTIGNMKSDIFLDYICDPKNQLYNYENDFNLIIKERVYGKKLNEKNNEKKRIRQISETKNVKKKFLIDSDIYDDKTKKESNIIYKIKKLDFNKEISAKINENLTYINHSNKKQKSNIDNDKEKINRNIMKEIYFKKISKQRKNERNVNNLSLSFLNKTNKIIYNNILKKQNFSFQRNDKNFNKIIIKNKPKTENSVKHKYLNLKKNNSNNKNNEHNIFIKNEICKNNEKSERISYEHKNKFLLYKNFLTSKNKINIKYKTNSAFKRYINHKNIFNKEKNNTLKSESINGNNQNSNSNYSSLNYNKSKIISHRNNKINILNDKDINFDKYRIKVDKKKLEVNSFYKSYVKDLSPTYNNKINKTINLENQNLNQKIIKYSKKIYKRNSKNKENSSSNSNFNFTIKDKFDYSTEINKLDPSTIQKSLLKKEIKFCNNDEKIYFKKKFILRNKHKNSHIIDFSNKIFSSISQINKNKEKSNDSIDNLSNTFIKTNASLNKYIDIREDYNTINNSKRKINKPDKSIKINIINNYSNIDNRKKTQKQIININKLKPSKKFNDYFQKNIKIKNLSNNNDINNNNLIRTSINNKNNLISLYNNLNDIYFNKNNNNASNKQINKNVINKPFNTVKNENYTLKQPQLCITNINFYNYIHNLQPLQKLKKDKNSNFPIKKVINSELFDNNKKNVINTINQGITNISEDLKSKKYIPFDLNSILIKNKTYNIKNEIYKILKMKKINYTSKDFKLICNIKDIRFEINILAKE